MMLFRAVMTCFVMGLLMAGCDRHAPFPVTPAGQSPSLNWNSVGQVSSALAAGVSSTSSDGPGFHVDASKKEMHLFGGFEPDGAVGQKVSDKAVKYDISAITSSTPAPGVAVVSTQSVAGASLYRTASALYALRGLIVWPKTAGDPSGMWKYDPSQGWVTRSASTSQEAYYFVYKGKLYRLLAGHEYISQHETPRDPSFEVYDEQNDEWDVVTNQGLEDIPHEGIGVLIDDTFVIFKGYYVPVDTKKVDNPKVVKLDLPSIQADPSKPEVDDTLMAPPDLDGQPIWADEGKIYFLHEGEIYRYSLSDNSYFLEPQMKPPFGKDEFVSVSGGAQPQDGKTYLFLPKKWELHSFKP